MPLELIKNPVQELIGRYCELFKAKYGTNPMIRGVDSGTAKRIIKDIGRIKALALIEAYFTMPDSYFLRRRHDLKVFETNLNPIAIFHDTGKVITRQEANQAENRLTNANAFAKMLNHDDEK